MSQAMIVKLHLTKLRCKSPIYCTQKRLVLFESTYIYEQTFNLMNINMVATDES